MSQRHKRSRTDSNDEDNEEPPRIRRRSAAAAAEAIRLAQIVDGNADTTTPQSSQRRGRRSQAEQGFDRADTSLGLPVRTMDDLSPEERKAMYERRFKVASVVTRAERLMTLSTSHEPDGKFCFLFPIYILNCT